MLTHSAVVLPLLLLLLLVLVPPLEDEEPDAPEDDELLVVGAGAGSPPLVLSTVQATVESEAKVKVTTGSRARRFIMLGGGCNRRSMLSPRDSAEIARAAASPATRPGSSGIPDLRRRCRRLYRVSPAGV